MSKPSALRSPPARARRPAPTAPPAGPESTLQAPARAASAASATPPEDCITRGRGRPAAAVSFAEPGQVAAEQGGEVGVDRGRRGALVLAEAGQDLVRGGDVEVGQALAQILGQAPLVRGIEVGEEQADRHRLDSGLLQQGRQPLRLVLAERCHDTLRPDSLVGLEAQRALDQRRRLRACRGGRGRAGPGGRSRARRRSRASRSSAVRAPRSSSSALVPTVIPWAKDSTSPGSAPARSSTRGDRGHHALVLGPRGARHLGGVDGARVDEDRVGEGAADVDPEQHLLSPTPRAAPCRRRRGRRGPRRARGQGRGSRCAGARRVTRGGRARRSRSPSPAGRGWQIRRARSSGTRVGPA